MKDDKLSGMRIEVDKNGNVSHYLPESYELTFDERDVNAQNRRIAACVNAMQGVPTHRLESESVEKNGDHKGFLIAELRHQLKTWSEGHERLRIEIERLTAENEALRADAEQYRWLRDSTFSALHLSRNGDHSANHMTAAEWIEADNDELFDDDPADAIEAMKRSNTIWTLQIYPHTLIGFYRLNRATLSDVIDAAKAGGLL